MFPGCLAMLTPPMPVMILGCRSTVIRSESDEEPAPSPRPVRGNNNNTRRVVPASESDEELQDQSASAE